MDSNQDTTKTLSAFDYRTNNLQLTLTNSNIYYSHGKLLKKAAPTAPRLRSAILAPSTSFFFSFTREGIFFLNAHTRRSVYLKISGNFKRKLPSKLKTSGNFKRKLTRKLKPSGNFKRKLTR